MKTSHLVWELAALAFETYIACAYDPGPFQDFRVATNDPKNIRKYYTCANNIFINLLIM